MKGIILAGGSGTRLYPLTRAASKQLMPIYDKPMIYYPLSTLMLAGIKEILIISTPQDLPRFEELLVMVLSSVFHFLTQYNQVQMDWLKPLSLVKTSLVTIVLHLSSGITFSMEMVFLPCFNVLEAKEKGATVFGYQVKDPERFGVVEFDDNMNAISIEENLSIQNQTLL